MMPAGLAITVFSATAALVCASLAVWALWRTGEVASPLILFLAMTTIDVLVPAALYFPTGSPLRDALFLGSEIDYVIGPAAVVASLSVVLFVCGYLVTGSAPVRSVVRPPMSALISIPRAYLVLAVSTGAYGWGLWAQLGGKGSVDTFVADTLAARFAGTAAEWTDVGVWSKVFLPLAFLAIGVLFATRERAPVTRGVLLPMLGVGLAVTTFFRGTILMFVIGLLIVETGRRRDQWAAEPGRVAAELRRSIAPLLIVGAVGVAGFVGYGAVRNYLTLRDIERDVTPSTGLRIELERYVRGEGLIGIAAILDYYPRKRAFLDGRTIRDMLLLPIPRAVWPEKPTWYGIDDITRGMGWAESSQSAVTMPGELYANFGYAGIALMFVWGAVFGAFRRFRYGSRFRFLYAFQLVPVMFTTCWMAFTGFMNGLIELPLMAMAVLIMVPVTPPRTSVQS